MAKRPLCDGDAAPLASKKPRVTRILLSPSFSTKAGLALLTSFAHLNDVEVATIREYGSLLPWLTAADVKRRGVTDAFVDVLSSLASNLREVTLSFNPYITDSSLMLLGFRCPQLVSLELQDCMAITSQGLESVLRGCKGELEVLDVRGCSLLDDTAASMIAMCGKLRILRVRGTALTATGLRRVIASCPSIEVIDVSGITLSSSDIQFLVASLTHLRNIDVSFCPGLPATDVQSLFDVNPCMTVKAFGVDLFGVRVPSTATLVY